MTEDNKNNGGKLALITLEGLEFDNDFGQTPIGLGHFSSDQGFIAVASLVGFFVGCAVTGNVLAGALVIVAGLNDIGYARRKNQTPTQPADANVEAPAIDVEARAVNDTPNAIGPVTKLIAVDVPVTAVETTAAEVEAPAVTPTVLPHTQMPQPSTPTKSTSASGDIALDMARVPKSTIIAASPRVGKGYVVSQAIAHLQQLHPDLEIWLIDPKDEPTERHYWSAIDPDKRCHFDLRDFDVDVEAAIEVFSEHLTRFNRSPKHRKLLIIDEFVTLNQKCAGPFMNQLKDFIVGICSSGEVNPDMGIGRFVWAITQSPYVSDIGFKTKAALATFQRVFLLNKASVHLYQLAVSASFAPAGFEQKINRLLEPTGRISYYSRTDSWHPVPSYSLPNSSNNSLLRAQLEGLLKNDTSDIDISTPKKNSSEEGISDTGTDTGIDTADTGTPENLVNKGDTSDTEARSDTGIDTIGDTSDTSRFTPARLTKEQLLKLVNQMKISEMSQTQIIQTLWSVDKNKAGWKQAYNEYKGLTGE